jgi:hypothetical protein
MKNFFLIIFILLIIIESSYASDDCSSSCTIKDAPAEILQKFIENQRTVLSNIANAVS